jgi:hypothetical protein
VGENVGDRPHDLTEVERRLWAAYPTGTRVVLGDDVPDGEQGVPDGERYVPDGERYFPDGEPQDRTVRAEVIAQLLLGRCPSRPGFVPAVRLRGAHITGRLDVSGGAVACELRLERCRLAEAPNFANAQTRQLRIAESLLPGLDGGGLRVDGYFSLSGSVINGQLRLPRAQLMGGFRMNGTTVTAAATDEWAVFSGGLIVEVGAFIRNAEITGGVRLVGARMNGGLFMEGTTLRNPGRIALDAQNMIVEDAAELSRDFVAEGTVRLRNARINGTLSFSRAILRSGAPSRMALHGSHMQVDELNLWTLERIEGRLSLSYSRIGVLLDSPESWPQEVWLNALTYDSLRGCPPAQRLDWVGRDREFHGQPYEQLATWYRQTGHEDLARLAQLARQRARRRTLGPGGRLLGQVLDLTVGYGYRPWRAAVWFALLTVLGTVVFSADRPHALRPPDERPHFTALVYTLDLLIPIGTFGQRDAWDPIGWTQWLAYGLIVCGWILATALIAGVTRVVRPN